MSLELREIISTCLMLLVMILCSCEKQVVDEDARQADALFNDLCSTYRTYTDSLSHTSDSISTSQMEEALDKALIDVYAKYKPDLDASLTEAQNDTLWLLASKYMKVRSAHNSKYKLAADTIVSDTLLNH